MAVTEEVKKRVEECDKIKLEIKSILDKNNIGKYFVVFKDENKKEDVETIFSVDKGTEKWLGDICARVLGGIVERMEDN